jgi:hypothetical protein
MSKAAESGQEVQNSWAGRPEEEVSQESRKARAKRLSIEAVYSFLKTQCGLAVNEVRGLKNVASDALYSILCLV